MTLSEIEGLKHTASWCNAVGNAIITTGFLAPLAATMVGVTVSGNVGYLAMTNGLSLVLGVILHSQGGKFLLEIEP